MAELLIAPTATRRERRRRLRLLFLLPFPPRLDALHGGGKVGAQLLDQLATRHEVGVMYLRARLEPPIDDLIAARCAHVLEVSRPWTRPAPVDQLVRIARLALSLPRRRPMWATDHYSPRFGPRLRQLAAEWQPDIVQAEMHIMGQYFAYLADPDARPSQRVLVEHELGSQAAPYLKRSLPLAGQWLARLDKAAWRTFEGRVIAASHAVVVFTQHDYAALAPVLGQTPAFVVPFGSPIPRQAADPGGISPPCTLFVGNFLHPPNIDGALWLARDIFPLLQDEFPAHKLLIVGDQPPPVLTQLASAHIIVTGRVPDIWPYLESAAIIAAPLRSGGGMRVKVLEALAAGKAIVATTLATHGLAITSGDQLALADTGADFARSIAELLRDPARRMAMARRARVWAEGHLPWPTSVEAYEAIYDRLLTKRANQNAQPSLREGPGGAAEARAHE